MSSNEARRAAGEPPPFTAHRREGGEESGVSAVAVNRGAAEGDEASGVSAVAVHSSATEDGETSGK